MHWVDRGREPDGVTRFRAKYTQRWVEYYPQRVGKKPSDTYWRTFHQDLERVFYGLCAYCEQICRGEVDHFRPKSCYPGLVYDWSNWLFACHDCNQAKGAKWPCEGYVDPCAPPALARPEDYFDFDSTTGEILPRNGLNQRSRNRAQKTIANLRLNARHHLKTRRAWLLVLSVIIAGDPNSEGSDMRHLRHYFVSRNRQLSSIVRTWFLERGYPTSKRGPLPDA